MLLVENSCVRKGMPEDNMAPLGRFLFMALHVHLEDVHVLMLTCMIIHTHVH